LFGGPVVVLSEIMEEDDLMTQKIERLPAREDAPRVHRSGAARTAAPLLFALLVGIASGAIFFYDFQNHSVFGFVVFEAVFVGLAIRAFLWLRALYRA